MPEPGGEEVNQLGGRQSKLYVNYDLIDPHSLEALAAILHRGKKYGIDNWRSIDIESHLNHAMHHIVDAMKRHTEARLRTAASTSPLASCPKFAIGVEDDLAHAMCRVMFALAKEIEEYGIHPEHSDPQYHEPADQFLETASAECNLVRDHDRDKRTVSAVEKISWRERDTPTFASTGGRHNPERPPQVDRSPKPEPERATLHSGKGRGRQTPDRRKQ